MQNIVFLENYKLKGILDGSTSLTKIHMIVTLW